MKVILLSGPPGSGKDTVAYLLSLQCHGKLCRGAFAKPLKDAIGGLMSVSGPEELELMKRADQRIRKLMIGLSEDVVKPVMGMDWFANTLAEHMFADNPDFERAAITDCGFQYEVDAFIDRMRAYYGEDCQFQSWRIERPGHTYAGDSRSPITLQPEQGENTTIYNFGELSTLMETVNIYCRGFWGKS